MTSIYALSHQRVTTLVDLVGCTRLQLQELKASLQTVERDIQHLQIIRQSYETSYEKEYEQIWNKTNEWKGHIKTKI
ncbi:MAG: hypothetical protein Sylvanvirus3_3 [Sylvanvirus sp.]|uniref:Uncharacterized protein n=1 Tax=Sylvanvirus sp. TaxID=2487774 RepID=A0A3G5AKS3_9VIRU|nr:MAG: hypothetical protein Sylvanvirus3_3 [Sylvanvirus sp.]